MIRTFYFGCDFLYTAARVWGSFRLMEAMARPKWKKRIQYVIWTVTVITVAVLNVCNNSIISALFSNGFQMIIVLLLSFTCGMTFHCRYRDAFGIIFLLWTGLALADFFVQTIAYMVLSAMGQRADILLTATLYRGIYLLLFTMLFCVAVRFVCRRMKGKNWEVSIYLKWGWLLVLPLFLCMIYFQRVYKSLVSELVMKRWWLFLTGNMLMILVFGGYLFVQKEKERGRLLKLRMSMMERDYRELLRVYEEKEILLHDIKKHMQAIRGMAEEGRMQEICCYLDDMNGTLQKGRNKDLVNHDLLNLILNQKFWEADEANISLEYEMEDMADLQLKSTEICALFSNILDNAIEANLKIEEEGRRWIKLACKRKGQILVVSVSNPMAEQQIRFAGRIPETTKRDKGEHGFGIRSIRQIAFMHDGHMLIEAKDEIFSITIYLKGF